MKLYVYENGGMVPITLRQHEGSAKWSCSGEDHYGGYTFEYEFSNMAWVVKE